MKSLSLLIHRIPPAAWKIGVSAVLFLGAVVALLLLARRFGPKLRAAARKRDQALLDSAAGVASLTAALTASSKLLEETSAHARQTFAGWSPCITALPVQLRSLAEGVARLRDDVASLHSDVRSASATSPQTTDLVTMEREALKESWRKFRENRELSAAVDAAVNDEVWRQIQHPLLVALPKTVPDDLKPTFDAALMPVKDYDNLVTRFSFIPRLVSGELGRLGNDAQEVARTRDAAQVLMMTQSSALVADCLGFRLRNWITDTFLPFADLFLQKYQQARLERRAAELEEGNDLVRRVLRVAAVDPIDVTLGETPFDSTRHVGRSTANDPRFSDGVIVAVIRNGFVENGGQIIRQPEVVVNRMR